MEQPTNQQIKKDRAIQLLIWETLSLAKKPIDHWTQWWPQCLVCIYYLLSTHQCSVWFFVSMYQIGIITNQGSGQFRFPISLLLKASALGSLSGNHREDQNLFLNHFWSTQISSSPHKPFWSRCHFLINLRLIVSCVQMEESPSGIGLMWSCITFWVITL